MLGLVGLEGSQGFKGFKGFKALKAFIAAWAESVGLRMGFSENRGALFRVLE